MTAPVTLILRPHDTLFLRDGRPFDQGAQEQAATAGIFPPYPPTVVGAMRAALARAKGWPGNPWPPDLGSGVDFSQGNEPLGRLRFSGPFVLCGDAPLFPAPLCLLVKRSDNGLAKVVRLGPGTLLECDLGCVSLPKPLDRLDGGKAPEDVWIDGDGLKALLDWTDPKPESLVPQDALWKTEARVGIARDETRRTTGEGALYAAAHIRLKERVAIAVSVEGADLSGIAGKLAPLGGEGRSVWVERSAASVELPPPPDLEPDHDGVLRYTVVLLTPAFFGDAEEDWPKPDGTIRDDAASALPGRVVSACVGKPVPVGGWDGINHTPLPLRPLAPAGSVWFMEAAADDADAVRRQHGMGIGRATGWGFGLALIGRWERGEHDGKS
jgi:CRISPR-associated protein Cmr3